MPKQLETHPESGAERAQQLSPHPQGWESREGCSWGIPRPGWFSAPRWDAAAPCTLLGRAQGSFHPSLPPTSPPAPSPWLESASAEGSNSRCW